MEKGTAAHPSSTRRPASSSTKPTEDPSMPKPSTTSTRPTLIPDMTLTRPTTDTFMEAAKPTMGTSLLQKSEISQTRTEVRMTQEEYRRQEVRQTLDKVNKRIVVTLPKRGKEEQFLSSNRDIALKVLNGVCKKAAKNENTKLEISKAFD